KNTVAVICASLYRPSATRRAHLRRADLDIAHAGASKPRMDGRQTALVEIAGIDLAAVFHRGGKGQSLTASAGAKIDHVFARFCTCQKSGQLRSLVLNFDPALEEN